MGEAGREAGRRPHRRRRLPHPCLALAQQHTFKKKESFFRIFSAVRAPDRPPAPVASRRPEVAARGGPKPLIAQ